MSYTITPELVEEMRSWALECEWLDADDLYDMDADTIMLGIQRHYFGGIAQFIADGE